MTDALTGSCRTCGYVTDVSVGLVSVAPSMWPVYCLPCADVTVVELLTKRVMCAWCGSEAVYKYGSDMLDRAGGAIILKAREDRLTDDEYICPKCRRFTLRFELLKNPPRKL